MKTKRIDALWTQVHALVTLAGRGSYTAAAARLGVSKAAMSHRIGELEQAAGVELVRRTTRSVRLTEAGQQLVDATRASFLDIERGFAGVKDLAEEPSGRVRVTAPVALGRQEIVPLIAQFLRDHPQVRVEIDLSDRLSSLAQEGFDLAIRHAALVPDTHVAWTLRGTGSVLAATDAYLRRHGRPVEPAELATHNCLHYLRSGEAKSWSFEPARGGGARVNVQINGNFSANNSEALRGAALTDLGIALLPDFSAREAISTGRLEPVLPAWRPVGTFGDKVFAIRPVSAHVPRAVRTLVAFLRQRMNEPLAVPSAS